MTQTKFNSELIAPCGMNCAICKAYLAYTHGVPRVREKSVTAQVADQEEKTVISNVDAENSLNMKFNRAANATRFPARSLRTLTSAIANATV